MGFLSDCAKTPLECLAQLAERGRVTLRDGVSLAGLQAHVHTDLAATQVMQAAKQTLFDSFTRQKRSA